MASLVWEASHVTLPTALQDREVQKFVEDDNGNVAVRMHGSNFSGSFSVAGLRTGGRVTEVALNSSTWTALPATPLTARNALAIQNTSGIEIKLNYASDVVGYVGVKVAAGSERQYDITDTIIMYAKSASGTPTITVEEIA